METVPYSFGGMGWTFIGLIDGKPVFKDPEGNIYIADEMDLF